MNTYVFPREDRLERSDAIVVLGGLDSEPVTRRALELAGDGYSDRVIISDSFGGDTRPASLCDTFTEVDVECIHPLPASTAGEAAAIERLAQERGWSSVIVVTGTYHVSRARFMFERCYSGKVSVTAAEVPLGIGEEAYQWLYQTGAFVKALVEPGC
jgi:uncharacterized SAM-binding protein YcdF (DUF218 family)